MSNGSSVEWSQADRDAMAGHFWRLGWTGFLMQVALLAVPVLLAIYVLVPSVTSTTGLKGIDLSNYLSYGSLLIMIFTTYLFYRYTRLGQRINDPSRSPSHSSIVSTLWVGIWAGSLGIAFSMLLLFGAAWRLLFVLLANPQTGIMVAPTLGDNPTGSISAIDAVSLTSLLVMLAAELVVLGMTLWLLFKTTRSTIGSAGRPAQVAR